MADVAVEYGTQRSCSSRRTRRANPKNLLGQSKALCEWIVEAYGHRQDITTRFVAVRFGNVLDSSGSVIPIFRRQIEKGGPVTVTHPEMTRYFMTIPEAVSLVVQAGAIGGRGQVYVLDMGEPVKILDLAVNMIRLSGKEPEDGHRDHVRRRPPGREAARGALDRRREGRPHRAPEDPARRAAADRRRMAPGRARRARADGGTGRDARRRFAADRDVAGAEAGRRRRFWKTLCTNSAQSPSRAVFTVHGWTAMRIFAGLNPEQRRAVEAVRGPVCILAGAGSGKTTTITRRIANQVAIGEFEPHEILAVTFTDKAAGEMRERLERLGVGGVAARTFHSAALAQLHRLGDPPDRIMASKALLLRQLGNTLPPPYKFRPAGDLATEVEWAKNRRLDARDLSRGLGDHEPPIPADLMFRIFRGYEAARPTAASSTSRTCSSSRSVCSMSDPRRWPRCASAISAFTVDEYQDVNLLQQTLLDRWLGDRDELCVVGDDYQSIYAFTGATPEYLLGLPTRFPNTTVDPARGELPLVAGGARAREPDRAAARRRGEDAARHARLGAGAGDAVVRRRARSEITFVVERVRALHREGVALEEMAVLVAHERALADFEEALHDAKIPFQGASLLGREAARQLLQARSRRLDSADVAAMVRGVRRGSRVARADAGEARRARAGAPVGSRGGSCGWRRSSTTATRTTREFVADLRGAVRLDGRRAARRAPPDAAPREGARVRGGLHPAARGEGAADQAGEEAAARSRRSGGFYVGLTRAKRHLAVDVVGQAEPVPRASSGSQRARPRASRDAPSRTIRRVRSAEAWRLERAAPTRCPRTSSSTTRRSPRSRPAAARRSRELGAVPGVGPAKLERSAANCSPRSAR